MKKLMMLLLCGGLLVACSSDSGDSVKVSKSDDAMITGSELKMTKQDYFNQLLDQYGAQQVLSEALTTIADKEVTDQEEINKLVAEREKTYAKNANGDLEKYAKSLGYDSKEEYSQEVLVPDVKQELLRNKYIKENLEKMIKDYQVVSFKKIVVTKESEALTIIKESTSAEIFDKKLKDAGTNGEDAGIVTKNSTLDDNLKSQLSQLSAVNKDGVYSEAIKLSDDSYAVLYLYNTDHKNTDELINKLTSDGDVQKEIEGIYLKKYNFKVNDSKIKDAIKKLSSEYIE